MQANDDKRLKRMLNWSLEKTKIEKQEEKLIEEDENVKKDAELSVEVSKNEMDAFIYLTPPKGGKMLTSEEILKELEIKGVQYGVDEIKINEIVTNGIFHKSVKIASGLPPVDGKDGYVKYHVKLNRDLKPKMMEDGTVDFYDLGLVINVTKNQLLCEIIPPTKGVAGKTVTGKVIPAKDGKEARIRKGKNVVASEDGSKLYAAINGQPVLYDNKLSVLPIMEIKGDVGPATGNIDFLGSIIVFGNVKSGFSVKASGDIEVEGIVEAANLEAGGSIVIKRGIQGQSKGTLKAKHNIQAKYIENATIEAGENIFVAEAVMHSNLLAGKDLRVEVKKGLIVGGTIRAGERVVAKTIGSPMSTYTEIEVGINPTLKKQYKNICNKLKEIEGDLHKINQAFCVLNRIKDRGKLPKDKQVMYNKLLVTKKSLQEQLVELQQEKEKIDLIISYSGRASVSAYNICNPGVNIIIGNASLRIRDVIKHVTFYNYDGQIKFGPYEG